MESCLATSFADIASGSPTNIFIHLVQTLLAAQCSLNGDNIYPPDRSEEIANSDINFDFVIVGGGSAGSVLANRLTEVENWKVLLIEAGENPSIYSEVPGNFALQLLTSENYAYIVEPEKHACHSSTKDKLCVWSKGKALGGSSTLNALLYIQGTDEDFNEWSQMGNEGWSYDEVLPYFKKSHESCDDALSDEWKSKHCGQGGPLSIRYFNYVQKGVQEMVMDAARELNVPVLDTFNGDEFIGYGLAQGTLKKGRRISASKAFLSPIKNRKNLYVMKSTRADAILMDGSRAIGVRMTLKDGRSIDIKASKEVILSAGSIGSPHLLMLSGIGPKEHLREMGIPNIVDLPVGQNLQDHVTWFGMQLGFKNQNATLPSPGYMLDNIYEYLMYNRGPLGTSCGHDLIGFINVHDPSSKYPNIEFHHLHASQWQTLIAQSFFTSMFINEEIKRELMQILTEADMLMAFPVLLKPKSVGELKLRSKNPEDHLKIYANYYSEQEDLETMLKSVDFMKKMLNTETFKSRGIWLHHVDIPDCRHTKPDSEEYWRCNLRHLSATIFHPVGTTKMGPKDDPTAVVDSRLRVHGIQGLRVIDASIMPRITSGNTNAPTIMIGEKGADLIKMDWAGSEGKDEL